ncbi:MAG TPA: methionine synthase, partial [Anaerolineales bacterium]|nr:methionine synthase [Anaerolineales bacterium]
NALAGQPDLTADDQVQARKTELLAEAAVTLQAIRELGAADPFTDPETLARAVRLGILDAPHLGNNPFARGAIRTRIDARGACITVDDCDRPLTESARLAALELK